MSDLEEAKAKVATLFSLTNIKKVVCVDDFYEILEDNIVVKTLEQVGQAPAAVAALLIPEFEGVEIGVDIEEYSHILEDRLQGLDYDTKYRIYDHISRSVAEVLSPYKLATLLEAHQFTPLSPSEWETSKDDLLEEGRDGSTLFLFDQNLGGGKEDEGMLLIRQIANSPENENIVLGLLSSTFTPEDEYRIWLEYFQHYNVEKERFLLISKRHETYSASAAMIKLIALNRYCKALVEGLSRIMQEAQESALTKVTSIDIYDFERIVFSSSIVEGVWEVDTLLRVHGIYQRPEVFRRLRENREVKQIANIVRQAKSVSLDMHQHRGTTALELMHLERFDSGEHLNSYYIPLDLGDIFRYTINEHEKFYVLLAQPCDLMIRDGERSRDKTFYEVTLARVKRQPLEYQTSPLQYRLEFSSPDGSYVYVVDLQEYISVKLSALDLCVFNPDGFSTLNINAGPPDALSEDLKPRFEKLKRYFRGHIATYQAVQQRMKGRQDIIDKILPAASQSPNSIFSPTFNPERNEISYGFQRVLRLRQPASGELLLKYASVISRLAFDHNLDREN